MNRFEYIAARLFEGESFVIRDRNVKLYDGDDKTQFEEGEVVLTTHRLFWGRPGEIAKAATVLCLQLKYIVSLSEETASSFIFGRKIRIIIHLRPPASNKAPGPMDYSRAAFIKLSGKNGLSSEFSAALKETVSAKVWEAQSPTSETTSPTSAAKDIVPRIKLRTGIGGIERSIEQKNKQTDENIALAFQDLKVLMAMAKDMVGISKEISSRIRERKGEISEDETVQFKSYLMSLGIDDPVTRDAFSSNASYFQSLGRQICELLLDPIEESGGMMSLADVYCRVNRSRGLELLSPEDLLNACHYLSGPIKLRQFPSGAMVLQMESQDDEFVANDTAERVEAATSMAIEELAKQMNVSLLLAKEKLLVAERMGLLCRDESIEGLRFYPNLLLRNQETVLDYELHVCK